ncbi:MAG TPA: hypothetical protein VKE70_24415 [Candidatus Solibacter sp.]|nr:hypothetical protein [Candidatus Solibacter sp.]
MLLILVLQRTGGATARGGTWNQMAAPLELRDGFSELLPAATATATALEDA